MGIVACQAIRAMHVELIHATGSDEIARQNTSINILVYTLLVKIAVPILDGRFQAGMDQPLEVAPEAKPAH